MSKSINELAVEIHQNNVDAGWWDNPREKGTLLMLLFLKLQKQWKVSAKT